MGNLNIRAKKTGGEANLAAGGVTRASAGGEGGTPDARVLQVKRWIEAARIKAAQTQATLRVSSPWLQLHGHSSSVCNASSTRSTSAGLRPTEPSVT